MELKIGSKITELRKKKGMTQEQLAAALSVSAPAVSKWETGSSYPDITLLCPLARALGTDVDALLAFDKELSEEDMSRYMTEIMELAGKGSIREAEEKLMGLLHAYPSAIPLKFSATAALSFFEMSTPDHTAADRERWSALKKELVQAIHDGGDSVYYLPSIFMLASLALAEDDLERAEELLKEAPANTEDLTVLWVRLHLQRGDREKALAVAQKRLYDLIGKVQNCLVCMLGEDMMPGRDKAADAERCVELCRVYEQISGIFGVGGGMGAGVLAEVYLRLGRKEEAYGYLERLVERVIGLLEAPNPLLFAPTVVPSGEKLTVSSQMRQVYLKGLERDACFDKLRGEERFERLTGRLRESLKE
ncbi:MAG: helix-turn-helix domain-containing protein [Firmicutes bacterium]|nr:helix-turn-helix domain-containing protein [Bacillota bacterium]